MGRDGRVGEVEKPKLLTAVHRRTAQHRSGDAYPRTRPVRYLEFKNLHAQSSGAFEPL